MCSAAGYADRTCRALTLYWHSPSRHQAERSASPVLSNETLAGLVWTIKPRADDSPVLSSSPVHALLDCASSPTYASAAHSGAPSHAASLPVRPPVRGVTGPYLALLHDGACL